jgi:plastocyanin
MDKRRIIFYCVILSVLIVFAAGCSANVEPNKPTPVIEKNTVLIQNYAYQPNTITIQKGETITWINMDPVGHTATGSGFDSGLFGNGQSYKHTFNEVGTFDYICTPHPYMKGKIIVK